MINSSKESERFYIILLSIIPGLGHFQLGLMQRGLTFLVACTGIGSMIIFVALLTSQESFLIFLITLPVLWIYNFFDVVQQLQKKERGEQLIDRTIFEDFEEHREQGKKSKTFASILAMFPGAGHMYLGLQRRGLQLMAAFLLSIYLLDLLRLSAFLFLVPIIWFYSFFDALQQTAKYGKERVQDEPIIDYFINHQRWIGIGLITLGGYYLLNQTVLPILNDYFVTIFNIHLSELYYRYFQTSIVALLLIGGGFKLLLGNKENKGGTSE
ncbi:Multi-TM2 domain protein [Bacillus cereus Rock4-2]|nr:Multi-TM2 domain protein [Bacillus cereus 172560W]EEL56866.1 Multi-TM2 domain protein [Bacillus cereus Rock4-2]